MALVVEELEAITEKFTQLICLKDEVPLDFFQRIRNKLETEQPYSLKLPVLFFFLKRCDLPRLLRFDSFLARLKQDDHKTDLRNLVQRLLEEESYRNAAGAVFEVEILEALLDAGNRFPVALYPKIPETQKKAEASLKLDATTIYIEATLLSQTADQEEIQDIGRKSLYEPVILSDSKREELSIRSVQAGMVFGVGDPYGDALRVIGKLDDKRKQLALETPNVICLGLSDLTPNVESVEWAAKDIFSGLPDVAQSALNRYKLVLESKRTALQDKAVPDIKKTIEMLERLMGKFKGEPRLSGILTFEWDWGGFSPKRVFRNANPDLRSNLTEKEWKELLKIFGFSPPRDVS